MLEAAQSALMLPAQRKLGLARGVDWRALPRRPLPAWEFKDYLGWMEQGDGKLAYGIFIANGRLKGARAMQPGPLRPPGHLACGTDGGQSLQGGEAVVTIASWTP
jgi:hypothetical protein